MIICCVFVFCIFLWLVFIETLLFCISYDVRTLVCFWWAALGDFVNPFVKFYNFYYVLVSLFYFCIVSIEPNEALLFVQ